MKYINVRHLLHNLEEATSELPVIVTKNGIPAFTIISMGVGITPEGKVADLRVEKIQGEIEEFVPEKAVKCSYFACKETATATGKVWEEIKGEAVDAPMCKKHALKSLKEILL